MEKYFTEIAEYNHFFNKKLIELFENNADGVSEKDRLLLTHLINAQKIWNSRITKSEIVFGVWATLPLETLKKLNDQNLEETKSILQSEDLEKVIDYKNSNGESFSNQLKDIIFHYLNHATYHRAQIATELKNAGLQPISSDYISYKR